MEITTLLNAFGMALIILFINATTWEGMIFERLCRATPKWISHPFWECIICMSPWWATGIGLPLFYNGYHFTTETIVFIFTTGGICIFIDTFVLGKREGL